MKKIVVKGRISSILKIYSNENKIYSRQTYGTLLFCATMKIIQCIKHFLLYCCSITKKWIGCRLINRKCTSNPFSYLVFDYKYIMCFCRTFTNLSRKKRNKTNQWGSNDNVNQLIYISCLFCYNIFILFPHDI